MSALLLTYTPPLHRDLRAPWQVHPFQDCGEMADDDYAISIYRAFTPGEPWKEVKPLINVLTPQPIEYEGDDFELWQTNIWFRPNRKSFRAAYRLARAIKKHNGEGWVMRRDLHLFENIDVAPNHCVTILDGEFFVLPERLFA
jgi:hypothetical protein